MTDIKNGAPIVLEVDPKKIDPNKVKAYALANKLSPVDAYRALLSKDLLTRVDCAKIDAHTKIVLQTLISLAVGDGG